MSLVHPSALVAPEAKVHPSASIGPFCIVGPKAKIGEGTRLLSHVVVDGDTTLGKNNVIHPFACVGGVPQDLKYKGEPARVIVGDDNTIREGVTINIGTEAGSMETRIGSGCLLMGYAHVAHDCVLGDRVVLANYVGLAGHVTIGDGVTFGGYAGAHQFTRVGRLAFVAGAAKVAQDVPPFCIAQGDRAQLMGVNIVGLRRAGYDREAIGEIRGAFKRLFLTQGTRLTALERVEAELNGHQLTREMTDFIRTAKRGVCPPRATVAAGDILED